MAHPSSKPRGVSKALALSTWFYRLFLHAYPGRFGVPMESAWPTFFAIVAAMLCNGMARFPSSRSGYGRSLTCCSLPV